MKVSPFTYAKLFLGRYRSQVLMVILGLTMVIVGLSTASPFDVITKYRTPDFKISMAALILIVSGLAGILITLRTKRRTTVAAGIMSLGMVGYYFFFVAFMLPDVDEDDINYMFRLALYIVLTFCAVFSLKVIVGSTQNTIRIVVAEAVVLGVALIMYILDIHHGLKVSDAIANLSDYHGAIVMIIVSIICLNMSDSKYVSPMKRLRMNVDAMETSIITINDSYMTRESLHSLLDRNYSEWERPEGEEVEYQLDIILYNRLRRELLVIRKWKDDDVLTGTFMPRDLKVTQFKHINFPIRHIAMYPYGRDECNKIRMYGDRGFFVDVMVRDKHIRKYRANVDVKEMFTLGFMKKDREQAEVESEEDDLLGEQSGE